MIQYFVLKTIMSDNILPDYRTVIICNKEKIWVTGRKDYIYCESNVT